VKKVPDTFFLPAAKIAFPPSPVFSLAPRLHRLASRYNRGRIPVGAGNSFTRIPLVLAEKEQHNEDRVPFEDNMTLKYRLSWEAPELLCLGADGMKPRYYKRMAGPLRAIPDITFIGDEAHCQSLMKVQAFPDEIFVQEKSGNVFMFAGL
jgi:hypothetical protein